MRIVISEFISLDGVVQAPGGPDEDTDGGFTNGGWSMPFFDVESMGAAIGEVMENTDALLFGRRTWQVMAGAWPGRAGDPFADRMNEIPKYVVVPHPVGGGTRLEQHDAAPGGRRGRGRRRPARARDGRDIQVMGSASSARDLIAAGPRRRVPPDDRADRARRGKSIFPADGTARPLELVSTTTSSTGVQICTYRPAAAA